MPANAGAVPDVGTMPFDLRTDDTRIHLYLDRVDSVPLGDLTFQTIMEELQRKDCVLSPDTTETIVKTIAVWREEGEDPSDVLIATGRLPEHGADGAVEWTAQCDPDRKPGAQADGNVSHYDSHLVALHIGDIICTFNRPTRGEPGVDVFNHELPARNGKAVPYQVSAGCHIDEESGHVIADVDGTLSTTGAQISVTEGLHLRGNVDFNTGHVSSPGDIQVDGSVVDLFRVDAGSDVTIRGDVRLAEVRAVGDLEVGATVATGDKGICLAGGNIRLRLVESSTIAAWGTIEVAKEAISTAMFAGKAVNSPHATLSGGVIAGRGGVVAKTLGSDGEVPTLVLAGVDWAIDRLTKPVLAEIEKLGENLEKRMPALHTLRASLKRLTHAQREQVVELEFEAQMLQDDIDERTAFVEAVRQKSREDGNPVVQVNSEIFPGVELRLGNRLTKIAHHMRGPLTFQLGDLGNGKQIIATTAAGNQSGMKTGRITDPLHGVALPEIPPDPKPQPEAEAQGEAEDASEES